jgi:hypothetical protein
MLGKAKLFFEDICWDGVNTTRLAFHTAMDIYLFVPLFN